MKFAILANGEKVTSTTATDRQVAKNYAEVCLNNVSCVVHEQIWIMAEHVIINSTGKCENFVIETTHNTLSNLMLFHFGPQMFCMS